MGWRGWVFCGLVTVLAVQVAGLLGLLAVLAAPWLWFVVRVWFQPHAPTATGTDENVR